MGDADLHVRRCQPVRDGCVQAARLVRVVEACAGAGGGRAARRRYRLHPAWKAAYRAPLPPSRDLAHQALRHFAGVLLHKPTVRARELAADGRHDDFLAAVDALFGIDDVA